MVVGLLPGAGTVWAHPPVPPEQASRSVLPPAAQADAAIIPGAPGFSFRYDQTFGENEVPYLADTQHFNQPQGLFVDSSGVYITETGGNRMLRLDPDTGIANLVLGQAGKDWPGQDTLAKPNDVTRDNAGNIWIIDQHRLIKYSSGGDYLLGYPEQDQDPSQSGSGNDRFMNALGLAIDGDFLYVADTDNQRVQIFKIDSGAPVYFKTLGTTGQAGGEDTQFNFPSNVVVFNQRLYVTDRLNNRIQIFDTTSFDLAGSITNMAWDCWGAGDFTCGPYSVAVNANSVYISNLQDNRVLVYDTASLSFQKTLGSYGVGNGQFWGVIDLSLDAAGNLYTADSNNSRVQKFDAAGNYVRSYGVTGVPYLTDSFHYYRPYVAVDAANNILVLESWGQRLIKLSPSGAPLWVRGTPGITRDGNNVDDAAHFFYPGGMDTDKAGNIFVGDNNRVQIFDKNGNVKGHIGTGFGSGAYQFSWVSDVVVDNRGRIFVGDPNNQRVQVFDKNLSYVQTLGQTGISGKDNAHFDNPNGLALDKSGALYVVDRNNCRVQKFSAKLAWVKTYGVTGACGGSLGEFSNGEDLEVDSKGRLYFNDGGSIKVFDAKGAFLTLVGGRNWGSRSGEFRFVPSIALDKVGNLYVADAGNHRIQKYLPKTPYAVQTNLNGFGNLDTSGISALAEFNKQLYAGTANSSQGGQIWRSKDGRNWNAVSQPGMGSGADQTAIYALQPFKGQLYAGVMSWYDKPAQLFRSADGANWAPVNLNGMGNPKNTGVSQLRVFGGRLYAVYYNTYNGPEGAEIWVSASGQPGDWQKVVGGGLGDTSCAMVTGMVEHNQAYYAVVNCASGPMIWRSTTGDTWETVAGLPFTQPENFDAGGMLSWKGQMYVSFENATTGAQLWRSADGLTWTPVSLNGLGDPNNAKIESIVLYGKVLYAVAKNYEKGLAVYKSSDGSAWQKVTDNGFGDSTNDSTLWGNASLIFKKKLFIGTWNGSGGGELWKVCTAKNCK
jgi:sugar lactone lactonase YvrE